MKSGKIRSLDNDKRSDLSAVGKHRITKVIKSREDNEAPGKGHRRSYGSADWRDTFGTHNPRIFVATRKEMRVIETAHPQI